jgi:hypothetical protein
MDLKVAIQKITAEYNAHNIPDGQTADPGEVAWEVRGALTTAELNSWQGEVAPDVIEAYRLVLDATEDEVTSALR